MKNIRNFSIIAHIDHGKSTLADRLIQNSGLLTEREMQSQVLDNMDLERERGITIKAQAVRLVYKAKDGQEYVLNLIDTPGHVDFNYEVSRSLAACEGAILVVDAAQGVEAQTLANVYLAIEENLEIVPVINKIDLPAADPERVIKQVEDIIGIVAEDAPRISAKTGLNIEGVFEKIIEDVPAPSGDINAPLRALIFDSLFDAYRGVIVFVRVADGVLKKGDEIRFIGTEKDYGVVEVGFLAPGKFMPTDQLSAGEVGYFTAHIKNVRDTLPGDTVTHVANPTDKAFKGYKPPQSMVYSALFPTDRTNYHELRDALDKLVLNDASLSYEPVTSIALGFGFNCGFLGLLHLEIIQERLEREYDLDLICTAPSVIYKIHMTDGTMKEVSNPADFPEVSKILRTEEPMVKADIILPTEYVGQIMEICQARRGTFITMTYIEAERAKLTYEMPLNEIIYDFFDALKSRSRGYASFDYELIGYQDSNLVKLDTFIHHEIVDALSFIVHKDTAQERGRKIVEKLKKEISRHQFAIPIQAAIGAKIVARETVSALRKDVTAKCYGGDITRKKKLLEKQKEGKKKMRQFGKVELPQSAFMSVLKLDED
ncbi:MAG: translation elongation factor 4 [Defluviitaleaceae bacterium]|nr:translation elongation factor 4 [Defluviitaleaceae bacterium]